MFGRRRDGREIRQVQTQLQDELRRIGERRKHPLVLYAEVTAVSVTLDLHNPTHAWAPMDRRVVEKDLLGILLRQLWSAFLLEGRPGWEALVLWSNADSGTRILWIYPEQINRRQTYDERRRTLLARSFADLARKPDAPTGLF